MRKLKITSEGQPCRHCQTPVVKRQHPPGWAANPGKVWYQWWFRCPKCSAAYMVEAAKRFEPETNHPDLFAPESSTKNPAQRRERIFASDDHFQRLGEWANRLYFASGRDLAPIPSTAEK